MDLEALQRLERIFQAVDTNPLIKKQKADNEEYKSNSSTHNNTLSSELENTVSAETENNYSYSLDNIDLALEKAEQNQIDGKVVITFDSEAIDGVSLGGEQTVQNEFEA